MTKKIALVVAVLATVAIVGAWACSACAPSSCPPNQVVCGTTCTNTNTDPKNCGICGTVCPTGQVCTTGICKCPTGSTNCVQPDGGPVGCGGGSFTVSTLDANAKGRLPIAAAVAPNGTIGVVYFTQVPPKAGSCIPDGGTATGRSDYELKYVEAGGTPEVVDTVQVPLYGLSIAYDNSNMPLIAYLGGRSNQGYFWCQSDLSIAYKQSSAWVKENLVDKGDEVACLGTNQTLSDRGDVVGLWASVAFDANAGKFIIAYRDVHDGQFPVQDWGAADLEMLEGRPGSWTRICCESPSTCPGGNAAGAGGANHVVVNSGAPAVVFSYMPGGAGSTPKGVLFARRTGNVCTAPLEVETSIDTRVGAMAAWDGVNRFGVVYEQVPNTLYYRSSEDGVSWDRDQVFGAGTGGWYPSIAFVAANPPQPVVAYFVCSPTRAGLSEPCPTSEQELRVSFYCDPNWKHVRADNIGVYLTVAGVDGSGNVFVVYRDSAGGKEAVKIARFKP